MACGEIVITEDEASKKTHQALFAFSDDCYYLFGKTVLDTVRAAAGHNIHKLHLAVCWENMLRLALWSSVKPLLHDVIYLLRKSGINGEELGPFRESDINDMFPWLYYGKRFDVLRRICNAAKARAESKIKTSKILVYCHLISDETGKIVASSL